MQAKDRRAELNKVKYNLPSSEIPALLRNLGAYPYFQTLYAPNATPTSYKDFRNALPLTYRDLDRELTWAAAVLKNLEELLTDFVQLERRFMNAWLLGNYEQAHDTLSTIESHFGKSSWLIEKRLALLQNQLGLESQKQYAYSIRNDAQASHWAKFMTFNHSMRMEPSVSSASYGRMISNQMSKPGVEELRAHVQRYTQPDLPLDPHYLLQIVGWDESSPVVDRYFTMLKLGQQLNSVRDGDQHQKAALASYTSALGAAKLQVHDYRLDNILYIMRLEHRRIVPCPYTLQVYDHYALGNYSQSLQQAKRLIEESPCRADLYEIYVKSCLRLKRNPIDTMAATPLSRVLSAYESVISKSNAYADSVEALQKAALAINDPTISSHIAHLLKREQSRDEYAETTAHVANITAPIGNPWQLTTFNVLCTENGGGDKLFENFVDSPSLKLQRAITLPARSCEDALSAAIFNEVPDYRRDFYAARILERYGRISEASELYERWLGSDYPPLYFDSVLRLIWARFLGQSYDDILPLIARTYIRSPFTFASMPVGEVLAAVQLLEPSQFASTPALAIVHDIYFKHISTDLDGERSDAFEDYLASVDTPRPSQLRDLLASATGSSRDILLYYLRYICVPRIMDRYTVFSGTTDLLSERIAICQLLSEQDPVNGLSYSDEIRVITQELVVGEGLRQVEQSRIYVDTESIRESVDKALSESFTRYTQLPADGTVSGSRRIVLQQVGQLISDTKRSVLYLPMDERTAFLNSMLELFGAHFVMNPRHGLSAYLSGRIRHGILPNHLRSPIQLGHLATVKDSKTGTYHPNEYWLSRYPDLPADTREQLGKRLADFTSEIDNLIQIVNQTWIKVKGLNTPDGLFDFVYSPNDLERLETEVQSVENYEEFVNALFKFFWEFTELSLSRVRDRMEDTLKPAVVRSFDELDASLASLFAGAPFPELEAAITKARTDMLTTLETVKSWFRLSSTAEKPDFELDTLLEIAIRSTNNCFRYSPLEPRTTLTTHLRFHGATLTSLVELLFLLLSNIVLRSGISDRSPDVIIEVTDLAVDWIRFSITNEVSFSTCKEKAEAEKSIAEVKELMSRNDPSTVLERDRGTGYARVQKILTHDLNCEHHIEFDLTPEETFQVVVDLNTSRLRANG